MRSFGHSLPNKRPIFAIQGTFLVVFFVFLSLIFSAGSSLASAPVFTNNNAPAATPAPGSTNNLVFDLTLPAPDTDTFLDSDGTSTTGAGSAAAISAGDALKALALGSGTLCGDTDGTTAPSNIVEDDSGGCVGTTLTTVDSVTGAITGMYTDIFCLSATDCKISYFDGTNKDLMMADCDDATCSSKTLTTVDSVTSADTGRYTSIYCLATDDCKISYYDSTNTNLMMADCDDATCSSKTLTTVDSTTSADTGGWTSIYCLSSIDCKISYTNLSATGDLLMADCDDATCATKTLTTVDSATSAWTGYYSSIYCLATDDCKISYQDVTNANLMVADCDDATCATKTLTTVDSVTSTNTGSHTSIYCLSTTDCKISYQDALNKDLMMADCDDATCSSKTLTTVDSVTSADTGSDVSIYCLATDDCKIAYHDQGSTNLMMADCGNATCSTVSLTTVDSATSVYTGLSTSIYCLSSTDCKISYRDVTNTNLMMADCNTATCAPGTRTVVLGTDTDATNALVSSTSQVTFVDTNANNLWDDGEDIYFDVDDSNLYNADTLDAITLSNTGTAVNATDISLIKLYQDQGDTLFDSGTDTSLDAECSFNATSSNWECDTDTLITASIRVFVSADLAVAATSDATLIFQVPAVNDANTNGAFNANDTGVFFASHHDGPSSALTNANTSTITASSPDPTPSGSSSGSTPTPSSTTGTLSTTPSQGGFVSQTTTTSEGSTTTTLTIPRDALHVSSIFTIASASSQSTLCALSLSQTFLSGSIFDYSVEAGPSTTVIDESVLTTFVSPLAITISSATTPQDPSRTAIHYCDEITNTWVPLPTSYTPSTTTFSAPISHFTLVALIRTGEEPVGGVFMTGDLITTADSFDIYIVKTEGSKHYKRLILNPEIFESYGFQWGTVKQVSQEVFNSYTTSTLGMEANSEGSPTTGKVYELRSELNTDTGTKHHLDMTPQDFEQRGYEWGSIFPINHVEASATFYGEGEAITSL